MKNMDRFLRFIVVQLTDETTYMIFRIITALLFCLLFGLIYLANIGGGIQLRAILLEIPHGDKFLHLFLMGTITAFLNISLDLRKWIILGFPILAGTSLMAVGITLEEFSQGFNPYRNFELLDLLSNYIGIFVIGSIPSYLAKAYPNLRIKRQ